MPADELAALYHKCWKIETAYDEMKTHLLGSGALLRSKTPELAHQEFGGLMLAHYAVRRLTHEAAQRVGDDPDRLSFQHATYVVRRLIHPGAFPPRGETSNDGGDVLGEILEERVASSRGRTRPRGIQRKMSGYPIRARGPLSRRIRDRIPELCPIFP